MTESPKQSSSSKRSRPVRAALLASLRALVVLLLLAGGIYAAYRFQQTPGAAMRDIADAERAEASRLVVIETVRQGQRPVLVRAMGVVTPADEAVITPRVSGAIVEHHPDFVPGGFFRKGDFMLQIERVDYEQAVEQRESDLARARAELQIELGDQAVAREELELLQVDIPDINRDLILRIPQVNQARAEVRSAEAALQRAQLDLERTRILAPFDGHIIQRDAAIGANVGVGDEIATFVGASEYWIELTVPLASLRWIQTPRPGAEGSRAIVRHERAWAPGASREGRVVRRIGELERGSRLARLLVSVPDPVAPADDRDDHDQRPELLLGAFVEVEIQGRPLESAFAIDRDLLREGDVVWVMGPDDRLTIKPVSVAYRGPREVYITEGLSDGDRVVRTNLTTPVEGMLLRVASPEQRSARGD